MEFDAGALLARWRWPSSPALSTCFDGGEEAVAVLAHDGVERWRWARRREVAALEGFEVEADAGDGGFELVGDGVEEGVLALVAADFADEEDGVEDDAGDEDGEEDDAEVHPWG
jgi:hypothetical protein